MLKITLKKDEKLVLNGAVLRAAARTELYLENDVAVLRGRDVMAADEADTPARRLYFACMMAYLDPVRRPSYQDDILTLLADLLSALESLEAKGWCMAFARHVGAQDYYRALSVCRLLMDYEAHIFAASRGQTVTA
jgi:flagellar protein FlbT